MVNGQKIIYMETWWAKGKGKKKSSEKILLGLLLIFTCYPILTRSGVLKIYLKIK
jgi:hypothetical protein